MNRECTGCTRQELKTMRTAEQREDSSRALTDLSAWQGCCKKIPQTGQLVHSWKLFSQLQKLRSTKQIQWQILSIVKARILGWWVAPTLDIPWQQGKARFLGTFVKGIIPLCISFMAYGLLKGILYISIFPSGSRYLHVNLEGCEQ